MFLTTIWERYFLKEMIKTFLFFLLGFYGLYMLIDYSTHAQSFSNYRLTFKTIIIYYGTEFITRLDVLVPFAILISCIKTLCKLNANNELTALRASGVTLKRLLSPFIVFALLCTVLLYVNAEKLIPLTTKYHKQISQQRAKAKEKKYHRQFIRQITLEDGSSFIFHFYNPNVEIFEDVYWIRSVDDIYRIGTLQPYALEPLGKTVEHLQRNPDGDLVITESFPELSFPNMLFNQKTLLDTITLPEKLSLSTLKAKITSDNGSISEKEVKILTTFHYKLALPWLCLIAVIAPAPFCMRYSRSQPIFFIYALSIFGLFALYLVMDAGIVLAERQIIAPLEAIWTPICAVLIFFGYKYCRLK